MASKSELQINTSLKSMGGFVKLMLGALGALSIGGAGSLITSRVEASSTGTRIEKLEAACGRYDVRLATSETKMEALDANLVDIKKDLAEIRATNTQILLILRRE